MNLDYYWDLTLKQFEKHLEAFTLNSKERIREVDFLNYNLGKYIGIAFNSPKKYPKKPLLQEEKQADPNKIMSSDEMEKMARRNTIMLGGKINDNR